MCQLPEQLSPSHLHEIAPGPELGTTMVPPRSIGYTFIPHVVDDHSRFVYSEILPDETKETASALVRNAIAPFAAHGVKIRQVLTDNGACYNHEPVEWSEQAIAEHKREQRERAKVAADAAKTWSAPSAPKTVASEERWPDIG